jgi:hypothetical protein
MDNELINRLDKIILDLNNSTEVKELLLLKERVLNNKELLSNISKLQKMDKNDSNYMSLKNNIFSDPDYKKYKELENKLYYFSLETGMKLSNLSKEV